MGKQLRNSAGLNRPQYTEAAQKVAKLVYQHKTTPVLASLLSRDEKTNPTLARCKFFNAIVDAILISIKNESSLLIQEPDCFVYNDAIYSHVGGAEFAGAVLARALFIRVEEAEQFRKEFRTEYLPMYMDLVREVYSDAFKGNPPSDAPEKFIEVSTQRAYVDATFSLRMFQAFRASLVAESEAIILDETKKLELLVSGDVSSTVTSGNGAKKTLENIVTQKIAAEKTAAEKIAAEKAKIQQYDDIEEQLRIVVEISSQIKPEDVSNLQDEAELFSQVIMKALLASPTFQQKFDRILKSLVYEEQKSDILGLLGKNAKADEFFSMASQFLFRPHSQLQTAVYPQFWLQKVLSMYDSMKHNRASFDPKSVGASAYTHFYSDAIEGR
ncbi:MAG: hypothetical protein JSS53_03355, partial [Proteobacteria bacterium]|nr:hypothetical protein [Pseudomonadota bacterium]